MSHLARNLLVPAVVVGAAARHARRASAAELAVLVVQIVAMRIRARVGALHSLERLISRAVARRRRIMKRVAQAVNEVI